MAEDTATEEAEATKPSFIKTLMIPVIIGAVCGGIGFAVPMMFPALLGVEQEAAAAEEIEPLFLKYGEAVVNIKEKRMTRYLRVGISLQVTAPAEKEVELQELIDKRRPKLQSWLLSYLADLTMEDIKGAAGQNRLRREINEQFNWVLFPEGDLRVDDVLFEEFNIQ